jgi:hypothetical protein
MPAKRRKLLTLKKTSRTNVSKSSAVGANNDEASESEEKYEIDFIVDHRVVEDENKI